jgi:hypothetical protein
MSFYLTQSTQEQNEYAKLLQIVGCLSLLFSNSKTPYLYYRISEKIFCKAFKAIDLSRSDISVDAQKNRIGIGIKTFLAKNNKSFQKIAEFNSDKMLYDKLKLRDKIMKISELRNERLSFAKNTYNLDKLLYHCVLREKGQFLLFETPMKQIQTEKIRNLKENKGSISFDDELNEYSFLTSKSTLTQRFDTQGTLKNIKIIILPDPLSALERISEIQSALVETKKITETIFLPLYGRNKNVFEKSGLNQWNADGRPRDLNEVYLPIPADIHHYYPSFFPDRNTPFFLKLPDGSEMKVKVCQDGGKALMSFSNRELGRWILRDVLRIKEGQLLTYTKLQTIGIDSVRIDKMDNQHFEINFSAIDSYQKFSSDFKKHSRNLHNP